MSVPTGPRPVRAAAAAFPEPLAATSVSATPGSEATAILTWSAVTPPGSGSVSYYVLRDGGSPAGNCPTQAAPTSVLTCTDSGLSGGTHSYTVTVAYHSWTATSSPATVTIGGGATVAFSSHRQWHHPWRRQPDGHVHRGGLQAQHGRRPHLRLRLLHPDRSRTLWPEPDLRRGRDVQLLVPGELCRRGWCPADDRSAGDCHGVGRHDQRDRWRHHRLQPVLVGSRVAARSPLRGRCGRAGSVGLLDGPSFSAPGPLS